MNQLKYEKYRTNFTTSGLESKQKRPGDRLERVCSCGCIMAGQDVANTWLISISCAVPLGIAIGGWIIARKRDRLPLLRPRPNPDELIRSCIAKVVRELSNRAATAETKFSRSQSGHLDVLFIVDNETELRTDFAITCEDFEKIFRRELLLSGYFQNSEETVHVTTMSARGYDEYNRCHPLEM